jgi:hypothetical protein
MPKEDPENEKAVELQCANGQGNHLHPVVRDFLGIQRLPYQLPCSHAKAQGPILRDVFPDLYSTIVE